jgi:integrase
LNSAENRLRVLMVDHPLHRRIHLSRLCQEVGPPLFTLQGRAREMGIGSLQKVSLGDARKKASEARGLLGEAKDPLTQRRMKDMEQIASEKLELARSMTFDQCADAYINVHQAAWRNEKHRQQWRNTLSTYVSSVFGTTRVQSIDTNDIINVLEPIWNKKTETARRVRGRIEVILDWAKVRGYRNGENPARWRGHLSHLLPSPMKVRPVKHHAALPYTEIPTLVKKLHEVEGVAALALEFLILTAARTGEVIYARWPEVDLKRQVWVVPAERMKGKREHRVPLSDRAVHILQNVNLLHEEYIFPGRVSREPLSNMAMLMLLGRMNLCDVTAHGFRSTFRDWAAEQTEFTNEVVEMALAHSIGNKTEAAYRRSDFFEKRRALMSAWCGFCGTK